MAWQFGFDYGAMGYGSPQPLGDKQLNLRKMLRAQEGTEWIVVRTGLVMEMLFAPVLGVVDVEAGVVRRLGSWEKSGECYDVG